MKVYGVIGLLLGAMSLFVGCSSDDDGGAGGNTGEGGSGGEGGGTVECSPDPDTSVTDVSGTWALLQVGSMQVQAQGFAEPFTNRIVDLLLVVQTQSGDKVTMNAQYCDHFTEDPDSVVKATIPEAYRNSLMPVVRVGTFVDGRFEMPELVEVVGAGLSSSSEALPTTPDDPRVLDQDADQKPGVTILLSGFVDGEVHVVERKKTTLAGVALAADQIEGTTAFSSEQSVVDAIPQSLMAQVSSSEQSSDPEVCNSYFKMVRVEASTDCATLRAQRDTLFD
ncbi:hypothetical protein [Chondromyces crocatus]|uniref:Lipoprotein n=1 Tax=Chondromyces crocatus TaxID=52 RepID=A0A0K1EPF9_CHOCO|nr:hypothetical protein [Chondromyces crocatus]AKT42736.1 uncharacterized protein CMC5_069630 [Chondromyces crocatus]